MPKINETISKKYLYIGEVAAQIGCATSALRFYEDYFFIVIKKRNAKGERLFNDNEVKLLKWVAKACTVYKLHVVKIAIMTLPQHRFLEDELLTNEELTKIYETIRTTGRPNSH